MRYSAFTEVKQSKLQQSNRMWHNVIPLRTMHWCISLCLPLISLSLPLIRTAPFAYLGIPRPVPEYETEIKAILSVPAVAAVMPAYDHETEWTKQVRGLSRQSCMSLQLHSCPVLSRSASSSISHFYTTFPSFFIRWQATAFGAIQRPR